MLDTWIILLMFFMLLIQMKCLHKRQCYVFIPLEVTIMDKSTLKEKMTMPDPNFPMKLNKLCSTGVQKTAIYAHWHREMELLFITKGSGLCRCNNHVFEVHPGDLVVVNCNEVHYCQNISEVFEYDCIILDPYILNSRFIDLCDSKYITPIIENRILFNNHIPQDADVKACITSINKEFNQREVGFELALKASLYQLIVILMRHHIARILTDVQVKYRMKNIDRFNHIIHYIETHYADDLTVDHLSHQAHMSKYHFCRMFKKMTGHTVTHYINSVRIQEADNLITHTDMSMSEITYAVGFHDTSYFSRIYKMFKEISPSEKRKLSKK